MWNHLGDPTAGLTFATVGDVIEMLSGESVSATGLDRIAAGTGSRMERSTAAAVLRPVRRRFEVGSWGWPTTLWDPSSTLSEDLFFLAIEGGAERLGMGLADKERKPVGKGDRVTPGDDAQEVVGEDAREGAGEGAREGAGEGGGS